LIVKRQSEKQLVNVDSFKFPNKWSQPNPIGSASIVLNTQTIVSDKESEFNTAGPWGDDKRIIQVNDANKLWN